MNLISTTAAVIFRNIRMKPDSNKISMWINSKIKMSTFYYEPKIHNVLPQIVTQNDIINSIKKDQGHIWQIVLSTEIEALDNR